jgi:hypothetical protein
MQNQFYDDKIYEAQIRAGNEIIYSNFNSSITGERKRWTMLVAQMQSGKTGTYLFTAFEMLTQNLVSNVVIFSGNREIELREQTEKGLDDFVFKYSMYLSEVVDWDERERVRKSREALSKIRVVWGSGLKKEPSFPLKKTLFIFDESHYAQNKGMQVDRFLTKIGISATGGEGLEESDNYVLSVSATPMSELSDTIHHSQTKGMVYLEPGSTYYGVTDMLENGNILGFESEDWRETLISALRRATEADAHKYALIRMTAAPSTSGKKGVTEEEAEDLESIRLARDIATSAGWTCRFCDSDVERNPSTKINVCDLEQAPDENILVFLKGKCRMGQVVPKQHIAFGMETSKHPNTDVILQSLLGRFCGHHSSKNIMVYLPTAIVASGELEKYVELCSGLSERRAIEMIPAKAKNIETGVGKERTKLAHIIQLQITGLDSEYSNAELKDSVIAAFKDSAGTVGTNIINYNSVDQYREICEKVDTTDYRDFHVRTIVKKKSTDTKNKSYEKIPGKLYTAIHEKKPMKLGTAAGIDAEGKKIVIYKFGQDFPEYGFKKNDIFIDMHITTWPEASLEQQHLVQLKKLIPKTTGREIFSHALETGVTTAVNGGMLLGLKPETHCNVELMYRALRELIELSLQPQADDSGVIRPRRINSVINDGGESTGIQMTQEVCDAVHPDGDVFNRIRAEFGVELVVTFKMKKQKNVVGMKKSIEISW